MLGYVFLVENLANGKKFIGKNLSVTFDPEYYGKDEDVLNDVIKYGKNQIKVKMLSACDDPKAVDVVYNAYVKEHSADASYYNNKSQDKPKAVSNDAVISKSKRSRKKKDEPLS